MKIFSKLLLILLAGLSLTQAQSFQRQFNLAAVSSNSGVFTKDTLKILAIMVDFQADKYDATIGTGKFGSHFTQNYQDTIIDPLPHDADYFDNHLEFAKNYFSKASRGKLNIKYTTLPDVFTLTGMMRDYCPPYQSKDFTLLGSLGKEAWALAYQKYPNFNFKDYDLFIIFHAGVSNSLNTGDYAINRNLPALYLGENAFKNIYGSNFTGLVNSSGGGIIPNSIIMPETESREITAIDGSIYLLQISINGELVSNIASFLGLPDLYNTDTGLSAIGRFGLMDGQAMVANIGIFPPEPSAWEKIYLGWQKPAVAGLKGFKAGISAGITAGTADTTILKIPINDYEYYLIENRQQDAKNDGIKLTYKKGSQTFTDILHPDSTGYFYFTDSDIKGGVVIDVDEPDAAVPGNGIIIWHIDDRVINAKIAAGGINNDKLHKGVSLVEADGITDIGEVTKTVFGDVVGEGGYEDLWYLGNKAKYYKNKFADDTKPSSQANDGSNSFITLQNFSASAPKMTFDVSFGGDVLPLYSSSINGMPAPSSAISVKENGTVYNYFLVNSALLKYDSAGKLIATYNGFSGYRPAVYQSGDSTFIAGVYGKNLNIMNAGLFSVKTIQLAGNVSAPPAVYYNGNSPVIVCGTADGNVYKIENGAVTDSGIKLQENILQLCVSDNSIAAIGANSFSPNPGTVIAQSSIKSAALTQDKNGAYNVIILSAGNRFSVYSGAERISDFTFNSPYTIEKFILADVANSGENNIIFSAGNNFYAVNQKGYVVDNYPFSLTGGDTFLPDIISFDYDQDKSADFAAFTTQGKICFINGKRGARIKTLDLSTGSNVLFANMHSTAPASDTGMNDDLALTVFTADNSIYTWDLQIPASRMLWSSAYGSYYNNSFASQSLNELSYTQLLPEGRVYNWPNPVYSGNTNIRFTVNEDAQVTIKIFDMGGVLAAEFNKDALANYDTEVVWNVDGVKSGVYFARVEAKTASGKSEYKIIKIAVIK